MCAHARVCVRVCEYVCCGSYINNWLFSSWVNTRIGSLVKLLLHVSWCPCASRRLLSLPEVCVCQCKAKNPSRPFCCCPSWWWARCEVGQLTIRRVCRGSVRGVCAPAHACRGAHFIVVIIGDGRSCDVALGGSLYSRACSCLSRRKDSILCIWFSPGLTGGQNASGEQGVDKEACEDLWG